MHAAIGPPAHESTSKFRRLGKFAAELAARRRLPISRAWETVCGPPRKKSHLISSRSFRLRSAGILVDRSRSKFKSSSSGKEFVVRASPSAGLIPLVVRTRPALSSFLSHTLLGNLRNSFRLETGKCPCQSSGQVGLARRSASRRAICFREVSACRLPDRNLGGRCNHDSIDNYGQGCNRRGATCAS